MSNLAPANQLPTAQEFQTMKELGQMAIKSGLLPASINTPEKAVIIILKGRELGIPPMQAFSSIAVINGKPTMSAELMQALIHKRVSGAVVNYIKSDNQECVIEAIRPGGKPAEFRFTMEDAERAKLTGKGPWVTYPAAMLRARCISAMARAVFPDALSGVVYTPEELGAEIDDEGNIQAIPEEKPRDVTPPEEPTPLKDFGDYEVKVGKKWKGYKLRDIPGLELSGYTGWVKNHKDAKSIRESDEGREFLLVADLYMRGTPPEEGPTLFQQAKGHQ